MEKTPKPIGQILEGLPIAKASKEAKARKAPREVKAARGSLIEQRAIETAVTMGAPDYSPLSILYQHSVLCQTSLPYRNPGDEVRAWERTNGQVRLKILAGEATNDRGEFVEVGLPHGPKPRVVLMVLNQAAIRSQSPVIEIEDTLTRFVERMLKLSTDGRTIRVVKEQLARLAASTIRLGTFHEGRSLTVNSQIVTQFEIWFPRKGGQRPLFPSSIQLSHDYFTSLLTYAVALDELAIATLSHNALALDLYAWLAQRLYRIPERTSPLLVWPVLQAQFGLGYGRLRNFRRDFAVVLKQVVAVYPKARVELDSRGMTLKHSPPPVPHRVGRIGP